MKCLSTIAVVFLAVAMTGCGPGMYATPPQWPAGGQSWPPGNQMAPTPAQPQTFAPTNQSIPRSLDDVANVPASEALKLPPLPKDIRWHDVRPGDTLDSIARQYSVTADVLMEANAFSKSPSLKVGQMIRIP